MKSGIMQVHVPGRYEGTERRRGLRVHADVGATMRPLLPTVLERIEVRVLDESEGGLKLLTPGFLTPGSTVQIHLDQKFILGEVRHCTPMGNEFCVGVRFIDSVDDQLVR